jgi:hypothetical protein
VLSPITKLFISKESMPYLSEGLESMGAYALMEDSGIP